MDGGQPGQAPGMDEHRAPGGPAHDPADHDPVGHAPDPEPQESEPEVVATLDGSVSCISVTGELTEAARRPLVRVVTAQLLSVPPLSRVELQRSGVSYMNSAGMAVLVQLQRMTSPRAVTVALGDPPPAVARPLQLTGLWRRFAVVEEGAGPADAGG